MIPSETLARWRVPLGWVLGLLALLLARPTPRLYLLGLGLAAAGEALRLWAAGHLEKDRELTTSGPYARTRNPLYLGSLGVGAGFALATGRLVLLPLFLLLFMAVYVPVMKRESRRLAAAHPERYADYAERVPLFLPGRIRGVSGDASRSFSLRRAVRNREHLTLAGWALVASFLAGKLWLF